MGGQRQSIHPCANNRRKCRDSMKDFYVGNDGNHLSSDFTCSLYETEIVSCSNIKAPREKQMVISRKLLCFPRMLAVFHLNNYSFKGQQRVKCYRSQEREKSIGRRRLGKHCKSSQVIKGKYFSKNHR